jgi:diguanylate cyclase (GGDEF)-like protein/PAS domain S-box-containing protein
VLRRLPSAVIVVDAAGGVLLTNPAAVEVTGWRDDDTKPTTDDLVLVDQDGHRVDTAEILEREREAVAALVRGDGSRRWVALSAEALADHTGARWGTVIALQDVTAQRRYQERLHHLATHDPLTGLPNRTLFRERLDAMARDGSGYAVLLVDLNDFKRVNDTLGHAAGDSLLRAVADRLVHRAGPGATVARLGGDEFAILLQDADPTRAETVRGAFDQPFAIANHKLSCGGAVGLAIGGPGRAPQDVLAEADLAMYASKPRPAGTPRPRRPR